MELRELSGMWGLDTRVLGCFREIILHVAGSKAKAKATAKENAETQRTRRNAARKQKQIPCGNNNKKSKGNDAAVGKLAR